MESWEEMIKTLPSDETLARKEKDGTLKEFDRKLDLLESDINKLKEKMHQDNQEIERMFKELDIKEDNNSKQK